ncbi:MAG TPA: ParA family protein [Terriglobia bacterium]|nr:ParA family protein [Terriglobia bacterium]
MTRLVILNQRGGVAKTTTVHTLARFLADRGQRVLIIDTDPQGSMGTVLGLKPTKYLHDFVIYNHLFKDCAVHACPGVDVLCSNRETVKTEGHLMGQVAREFVFTNLFSQVETDYDAVLIDVAPSINLLQTCAMTYARSLLIPVSMDPLSLQGAAASIETARTLSSLIRMSILPVAILPVMVDRRLQMTEVVSASLQELSARTNIPLLPPIRTDTTVTKCSRAKQFLVDFDPRAKAMEDYQHALEALLQLLGDGHAAGNYTQKAPSA